MSTAQLSPLLRHIRKLAADHEAAQRPDRQLLDDFAASRNEAAFAALVARHGQMVLRVCRRVLNHEQDAEDAFQATFLILARQTGTIRKREALAAWLQGVAYRTALAAKRQAGRRRNREQRLWQSLSRAAASPTWDDVQAVLDEEIQRLPDVFRTTFVLCIVEGKSGPQAAAELGINEGTVSSRLTRARQRLQKRLVRRGIKLSAMLTAFSVAESGEAALSVTLAEAAIRSGLLAAAGRSAAGTIPPHVAALAAGVTRAMFLTKAKIAAIMVMTACLLAAAGTLSGTAGLQTEDARRPHATPTATVALSQNTPQKAPPETVDRVICTGQVLGPDGKPLAGARLLVPTPRNAKPSSPEDLILKRVGSADAEGRFHVIVKRPKEVRLYLVAHADGCGVDWVELDEKKQSDHLQLRLVKDVPITGRVVNTEGRPVAGVAVLIMGVAVPLNEKMDDYLVGWKQNWQENPSRPRKTLYAPIDTTKTDKDGRFALHGAGGERIAYLSFSGAGIGRTTPWVITRSGFDAGPYNASLQKAEAEYLKLNSFDGLYGPSLTMVAETGITIEGTVKDAASGQPVVGCSVVTLTEAGPGAALSDAKGRYRLQGLRSRPQGNTLHAGSPKGSAYLRRNIHVPANAGPGKVRLDIELGKGAVVMGRVVDKQTGKGVGSGVRFAPLAENKFFGSRPGFDNYRRDRTMETTDPDGRFRLVTIPGKTLIMVQVFDGMQLNGQHLCRYRRAVPDPSRKDLFKANGDSWIVETAGGLEFLSLENVVKVIDIKEKGVTEVELLVDPGVEGRIAIQDANGKALSGTWVAGIADHWPITCKLSGPKANVLALDPAKPRTMAFLHVEKNLGGTAVIKGSEKEPVVAKLMPLGKVRGQLLDTDGNPLEGIEVSVGPETEIGRELYRFALAKNRSVVTDKDGRFVLETVVPGLKFYLGMRQGNTYYVGEPRIGSRQVDSGQTLEMGTLRVKVGP